MSPRNGKIARLPRSIRDELNNRLEDSEESPELLDWLNALPDVREVLRKQFAGVFMKTPLMTCAGKKGRGETARPATGTVALLISAALSEAKFSYGFCGKI
jgi:hypothetical protein